MFTRKSLFPSRLQSYGEEVKKTKNGGRARYACALGAEVGGRCTFEKGFPVLEASLQISDEPSS